eukprot:15483340-Alexandrium_andersonii.AAC.1
MSAICQTHSAAAHASSSVICRSQAGHPTLAAKLQRGRGTSRPNLSQCHIKWSQVGCRLLRLQCGQP